MAIPEAPLPCSLGRIQICAYNLGASGRPREWSEACGRIPLQPSWEATIVDKMDQLASFFSFCLFFFLLLDAAQYKWPRHGFYRLRITAKLRCSFPVHSICRTIVGFVSCFFVCLFCSYADMQPKRSVA